MLICPHANRFASDPASELERKKINKKGNLEKAAKKAATEAALAQLEAAMANNPGLNNDAGDNVAIQPTDVNQPLPQPVANGDNVTEHASPSEDHQHISDSSVSSGQAAGDIMGESSAPGTGPAYPPGLECEQAFAVVRAPESSDDQDNDNYHDSDYESANEDSDEVLDRVLDVPVEEQEVANEDAVNAADADSSTDSEGSNDDGPGSGADSEGRESNGEIGSVQPMPMRALPAPVAVGHASYLG